MIRGLQSSSSGMIALMAGQEASANNLANANTAGYKRDVPSFGSILTGLSGAAPTSRVEVATTSDFAKGSLIATESKFNMALEGEGFFTVQTPAGVAYTRDGSFSITKDGSLVTPAGDQVLGTNGPIKIGKGDWVVDDKGGVIQGGAKIADLKIVRFATPDALEKMGASLWNGANAGPTADTQTQVRQGYLESSNVNTIREMVNMIAGYRTYEAGQKTIQSQDATLDKLVNEVGRV